MRRIREERHVRKNLVHLVYCESGIETSLERQDTCEFDHVHLVYCESGIETCTFLNLVCRKQSVHLVYCESGIETCYQ